MLKKFIGSRADWRLRGVRLPRPGRPSLAWSGTAAIVGSVIASWMPFAGAQGDGPVAFGLFIGAVAILLMAWSFILAIRLRWMERFFGGLDRMYRVHRWAGTLSIVAMALHTQIEPDIAGGVLGAAKAIADNAESLAETGEVMLYGLVGVSLLRWLPYRYWRLTHKLLGIPFVFACWHFFTAEKTYANNSPWGWWFGAFMVAGIVAWLVRVVGRDMVSRGVRYRVAEVEQSETVTHLVLEPAGRAVLEYRAGQFVFLKVQARGMSEPHAFTIASSPSSGRLRFFIRDLGDWTGRLREMELVGTEVIVEGPYGTFEPFNDHRRRSVWVAGGVGVTPFLAALDAPVPDGQQVPHLFYAVRSRSTAMALEVLEEAAAAGRLELSVFASDEGSRLTPTAFTDAFPAGMQDLHVAMCGPGGLVHDMREAAFAAGATGVESEDFDIRQGFGPDVSREIDRVVSLARR